MSGKLGPQISAVLPGHICQIVLSLRLLIPGVYKALSSRGGGWRSKPNIIIDQTGKDNDDGKDEDEEDT